MAVVIHSLWEKGDRNPLILPSTIPIDDARVQSELTRYLSDNWAPIIEKDVDGPISLPLKIDAEQPNLGKLHATRRVARTIYLGSAPTSAAAQRGLEDRRIKLGCVMPGESPAVFGDALRRLSSAATYLYQDGSRFYYATQPTVTKLAEDRAEQLNRDPVPDSVAKELDKRLRVDLRNAGDFSRVHSLPRSSGEVPDDSDARLVVLPPEQWYSKEPGNAAEMAGRAILESRGKTPRLYRNTLIFLAADKVRLAALYGAVRKFLAWESIVAEEETLNLDPRQSRQAESQKKAADDAVAAQLPEAYQWLLVPAQPSPQSPITWDAIRLSGGDALAVRASKKLRSDESLIGVLGSTILRKHLDDVPLWRGDHVTVKQLTEDFAQFLYLPRLSKPAVLIQAICDGLSLMTWQRDTFAYAESHNDSAGRYLGLRAGELVSLSADSPGLLIKPDVASRQMDAEPAVTRTGGAVGVHPRTDDRTASPDVNRPKSIAHTLPKRFHGTVILDPARVGRDSSRIAEEVIAHLVGLVGSTVTVTLEVDAEMSNGAPENVVRTVTENSRTLKFTQQGFETS
jgi:hypothetical protein